MNKHDREAAAMALSKPAQRLWERVQNPHRWYRWKLTHGRYMQELIDAGLVTFGGRVNVITACCVPVGTKDLQREIYPIDEPGPSRRGGVRRIAIDERSDSALDRACNKHNDL